MTNYYHIIIVVDIISIIIIIIVIIMIITIIRMNVFNLWNIAGCYKFGWKKNTPNLFKARIIFVKPSGNRTYTPL